MEGRRFVLLCYLFYSLQKSLEKKIHYIFYSKDAACCLFIYLFSLGEED